jgi:NADH:ubiquinone oxidoreductase subunit C
MEVTRRKLTAGDMEQFRSRQLTARQMLTGELEGPALDKHVEDSILTTTLDYYPEEPRLGIQYELLDMKEVDRITVRVRVPVDDPHVPSVTPDWPTADHQEREAYDMFGVIFDGHPDLRRILMPEDYEGHPQRRDFPVGGEPIFFTHNEPRLPRYTQ